MPLKPLTDGLAYGLVTPLTPSEIIAMSNEPATPPPYDSTQDTLTHIRRVQSLILQATTNLGMRAINHDKTKFDPVEKEAFDRVTPRLKLMAYGTEEYRACLREIKPSLAHHYQACSHHPEHFGEKGMAGMSLFDIVEMLLDWKAATERMKDGGDIWKSIETNAERFGYPPMLTEIFKNTAHEMGWYTKTPAAQPAP